MNVQVPAPRGGLTTRLGWLQRGWREPPPQPSLAQQDPYPVVLQTGRSGSTLLQSAFLSSCDVLTLSLPPWCWWWRRRAARQMCAPHQTLLVIWGRMADGTHPAFDHGCSIHTMLPTQVAHDHHLPLLRRCKLRPVLASCRQRDTTRWKAAAATATLTRHYLQQHPRPPARSVAIVHLVRDPRPTLASQRRLHWWKFGNTSLQSKQQLAHEMARVAKHLCRGILADVTAGERLQRNEASLIRYVPVRFEELATNSTTTERLSASGLRATHTSGSSARFRTMCDGDAAPPTMRVRWRSLSTHVPVRLHSRAHGRWKHDLSRLEKRAIARDVLPPGGRLGESRRHDAAQDVRSL